MNKKQKEIQQVFLDNEKDVLKKIQSNYNDALAEIDDKIALLLGRQDAEMQHVIYQVEYQKALKTQVQGILDQLQANEFTTVSEYLSKSYEDGFIGTMYDLQGQGIPLVFPIDQEQVVAAIQNETKLSESLYSSLGKDIKTLNKQIAGEISRGISNGAMYDEIARNISSFARIPQNRAMTIARTEAHRIQEKATSDAHNKAAEKGADIVKIWSAALDGSTRDTHRELDGQIRELDEPFEVDGKTAMFPGDFGDPAEDCNCRCRCNSKARWLLDQPYTKWSPDAPLLISDDGTTQYVSLSDAKTYKEFKGYYKDVNDQLTMNFAIENDKKSSKIDSKILKDAIDSGNVSKEINTNKQNRHIQDSKGYIEGRSYIKGNLQDAQKLVDELSGTGELVYKPNGEWSKKEKVSSNKMIGVVVNPTTMEETETKKATIHYSKTGSHIVPRKGE